MPQELHRDCCDRACREGDCRDCDCCDREWHDDNGDLTVSTYSPRDAAACARVAREAVCALAGGAYSAEQVQAWLAALAAVPWDERLSGAHTVVARTVLEPWGVADSGSEVAGFASLTGAGIVDFLYVAPDCQRQGVASRLLAELEAQARSVGMTVLTTFASIPAREFFSSHGYTTEAELRPLRGGVELTNYRMSTSLSGPRL